MNVIGSWVWARTAGCWYNQALNSPLATTCCEEATARLCYYSSATVVHSSEKIMQICKSLTTLWCVYSLCILKPVSLFSRLALNPGVRLDGKIVKRGQKLKLTVEKFAGLHVSSRGVGGGRGKCPPLPSLLNEALLVPKLSVPGVVGGTLEFHYLQQVNVCMLMHATW